MNKACPVVLRIKDDNLELLAFRHPEDGNQLVKGNIKKGESLENACIRELEEESGIEAKVVKQLGVWEPGFKKQIWGICLVHYEGVLPDRWVFETKDDGGHLFSFFWQPLDAPLDSAWNDVYTRAFHFIKQALSR